MLLRDQPGVYFARCEKTRLVKIGKSIRVQTRVRQLGYWNSLKRGVRANLRPTAVVYVNAPQAIESYLHQQLKLDRRRRVHPDFPDGSEWFELTNAEIGKAVAWALDMAEWYDAREPYEVTEMVTKNVYDGPYPVTRKVWPSHEHRRNAFLRGA